MLTTTTTKNLSLVEQKKLQWAREREEMMGLFGLWGRPKNEQDGSSNLLPPIPQRVNEESNPVVKEYRPEDESETSGYLSDSPKRSRKKEFNGGYPRYPYEERDLSSRDEEIRKKTSEQNHWRDLDKAEENDWEEKKMYKNYKNENWNSQNSDSKRWHPRNYWYGTPESVSSDDGSRLRWGDRGVGIGHLWKPVVDTPDCRLPRVSDDDPKAPKWVEKGLKNCDAVKSEILIINHPGEGKFESDCVEKNYLLGQNAPISPEVIEEREKKRKKAVEHQNAIKKQLEERDLIRKREKEKRMAEERLEEERIRKEREIERMRYEEEQRRIKAKEEVEKKREKVMKEAIEMAEKRAREEKKRNKKQAIDGINNISGSKEKFEKMIQPKPEPHLDQRKQKKKLQKPEVMDKTDSKQCRKVEIEKKFKDSSSQFDEVELSKNFHLLNVNGIPLDGGLALMLDNVSNDGNFLLPPDGVQIALLMSPGNSAATNRLLPLSPSFSESIKSAERILTPSKYRLNLRSRIFPRNKSTQTEFRNFSASLKLESAPKKRERVMSRREIETGSSSNSQRCGNNDRLHKIHGRFFPSNKHSWKLHPGKANLEDRPKWGINRPSIRYKKQSEKDPNYQRRLKEKRKMTAGFFSPESRTGKNEEAEEEEEKELDFVVRLLELPTDEKEEPEMVLRSGFKMNSNRSSPVFVPIEGRVKSECKKAKKEEAESGKYSDESFEDRDEEPEPEVVVTETEEMDAASERKNFLTPIKLEAIEKIANLREVLK